MKAKAPGFQWYVAWRYLMARPRRLSPAILFVTAFASWVLLAAACALVLHPFTDELYIAGRAVPEWVVVAAGAAFALVPTCVLGEFLRILLFARDRSAIRVVVVAASLLGIGVVSLVAAGLLWRSLALAESAVALTVGGIAIGLAITGTLLCLPRHISGLSVLFVAFGAIATIGLLGAGAWYRREPAALPSWFIGAFLAGLAQFPVTASMLLSRGVWRNALPLVTSLMVGAVLAWLAVGTLGLGGLAAVVAWLSAWLVLLLLIVWHLDKLFREARWLRLVVTAFNVFIVGVLVALAVYGVFKVVLARPELLAARRAIPVLVLLALGMAALALGIVDTVRGRSARVALRYAAWVFALLAAYIAATSFVAVASEGMEAVGRFGDVRVFKFPMWLVITAGIAAALIPMTLILAAIRYFFTFFSTVSIGGVAIGGMALVIVLSVMSGFETDLRDKILGSNAHLLVTKEEDQNEQFAEYRDIMTELGGVRGIVAQTPYLLSEVVIAANNNYANVIIKGIDPETVGQVTDLGKDVEQEDALAKLWPLTDDGGVGGPPDAGVHEPTPDAPEKRRDGGAVDPAPADLNVDEGEPIDLSGDDEDIDFELGSDETPELGRDETADPAPDDLVVDDDEPIDFSGEEDLSDELEPPDREVRAGKGDPPMAIVDVLEGEDDPFLVDDTLEPHISPRVARLPGVLVGRELVKQINLYEGQEVKVISPLGENTPAGPVPRTKLFRVAGTFFTGMYEYDLKFIYIELSALQDFLDMGDEIKGIEIRVRDPDRTHAVMARIQSRFAPFEAVIGSPANYIEEVVEEMRKQIGPHYHIQDWKELNRSLFSALKLEKIAMFLVLAIIILVASFSIVGNLIMVVIEKAKEIAVLKTLGASDTGVMKIFVVQGFFIGLVGTIVGVILGLIVCWLNIRFGVPLDPDVYYIDRLPMHVEPSSVIAVAAAGIVISVIATLYPAFIAARLRVVEGLRYE